MNNQSTFRRERQWHTRFAEGCQESNHKDGKQTRNDLDNSQWIRIDWRNIINPSAGFVAREIFSAKSRYCAWKGQQLWISFAPAADPNLLRSVMQAITPASHYCTPWELRDPDPLPVTNQSIKNLVFQSCWVNSRKEDLTVSVIRLYGKRVSTS
jgi:hypothetical protein